MKNISPKNLLKKAFKLCLGNTERFIKDSELLLSQGSHGHAFALAVLGKEELAKGLVYYICSEGILPTDFLKEVGRTQSSHLMKLSIMSGLLQAYRLFRLGENVSGTTFEKQLEMTKMEQEIKLKGLYVGLNLAEEIVSSPDSIKKNEVEKTLIELKILFEDVKLRTKQPPSLTQSEREKWKAWISKLYAQVE